MSRDPKLPKRAMTLEYWLNGECVNFQHKVETGINRCPMCGWEMQLVKK